MRPLFLSALLFLPLAAQDAPAPGPKPPAAAPSPAEALKKLAFLQGEWEGKGWMMFGPGQKAEFSQAETVKPGLGGSILTIEGRGTAGGRTVHHAFAVFSFDPRSGAYGMRSYLADGRVADMKVEEVTDKGFRWSMSDGRGGTMRYTLSLGPDGRWTEVGERSADGKAWMAFFGMELAKVR